ncbi:MAG: prepilin-type N-terminal cleavage/methylation domain-containing protein [Patescibacteria group bacterium]|nr:prepilin-type N-terminal cleavage/methylation domain-containing protein [Patescibacteria group bacterium]MDE2590460.1 prepilin-type N-terminal cleavage/methylation domain-containing protein [Patescibacteria group bacterium]
MTKKLRQSGFTLIELLLVVALITSLGAMTTAYMARFLTQNGVQNAQDQIVGDLRKAQFYTMMGKRNLNWGVYFNSGVSGNTIYLYGNAAPTTTFQTGGNTAQETFSVSPSIGISSFDINFPTTNGIPNNTGTITITGSGANESKTVTITAQGAVTR